MFSAVLVCFGVAMSLDLTGYEGYTPDAEEVEFVSVYLSSNGDYLSRKVSTSRRALSAPSPRTAR